MTIYEEIQERVDGLSIYSNYFACCCVFPDHDDSKPSLFVYEDLDRAGGKGRFYCSGCGKSGTHEYLWKVITGADAKVSSGSSTRQEQKFLPHWKRWSEQYCSIENLVQKAHDNVKLHPITHAWYLKKRNLMDVYEPCMLGYMEDWCFFPILDQQDKIVDVIVRDSKGRSKYIIHSNDEETPLLYVPSWDRVMKSKLVYIVYGLVDALALELCDLPVITGSTGKSLSDKRLIQLNKKYVIIPDKNEDEAARKLAKSLGNFTKILRLPFDELDCKDPDDVRMKHGLEYLKHLIIGE